MPPGPRRGVEGCLGPRDGWLRADMHGGCPSGSTRSPVDVWPVHATHQHTVSSSSSTRLFHLPTARFTRRPPLPYVRPPTTEGRAIPRRQRQRYDCPHCGTVRSNPTASRDPDVAIHALARPAPQATAKLLPSYCQATAKLLPSYSDRPVKSGLHPLTDAESGARTVE